MTPPKSATKANTDEVRGQILHAAMERFQQFGYHKTTMAEVAADCHMSASNLYRFFGNKQDIGAALAESCLDNQHQLIADIVEQTERSAADRLGECFIAMLHHTHHHWSRLPRLAELVDEICEHRHEVVDTHRTALRNHLLSLLNQGVAKGEFADDDLPAAVDAMIFATLGFDVPHFMNFHSLEEFEAIANQLARLFVNGLLVRD